MTNITDLIRRSFLLGLGAISLTADKVQEWTDELVERGEMTRDQATSMVDELTRRGQETRRDLQDMIKDQVRESIKELNLPTKTDLHRLEDKLDRLMLMQRQTQIATTEPGEASPEVI